MGLIIIFLMLITFNVSAGEMEVKTNYGYLKDAQGRIECKVEFPKGFHPLRDGYTYHEVADQKELDKIKIWVDPNIEVIEKRKKKARKKTAIALKSLGLTKQEIKDALGLDEDEVQ